MATEPVTPRAYKRDGSLSKWYGKARIGISVMEAARQRVEYTYDNFDFVWVSFSGGKDSTCVLNVALDVARERGRLPLEVVFWDEECISNETVDYVRRVGQNPEVKLTWFCLPVQHRNACSSDESYWWPWAPEAKELWVRDLPPEAVVEHPHFQTEPAAVRPSIPDFAPYVFGPEYGRQGCLMGIRAAESVTRLKAVANKRADNFIPLSSFANFWKVYPVYDWTTEDVWTAPAELGWDYNVTYDIMEMAGVSHTSQRCAPPFGEEPRRDLWIWAVCFPDLWEKMCDRVPGAAAAARYSRTELYGYGVKVKRPEELSWPEWINLLISRHADPNVRAAVAADIKGNIESHYKRTSEPILPTAIHPLTAVSWEWLSTTAERGDTKGRRAAMRSVQQRDRERVTANYERELAAYRRGELDGVP